MDIARGDAGRLVEHANRQSCCLQLDSGRSLDQIICDLIMLEFIASRRIGELARARSNIEGEALHTRHRTRARKRRQRASPRPVCNYVQIRVVICVNPRYRWAESVCVRFFL